MEGDNLDLAHETKDIHKISVTMGLSSAGARCLTLALTLDHYCLLGWLWPVQALLAQFSVHDK